MGEEAQGPHPDDGGDGQGHGRVQPLVPTRDQDGGTGRGHARVGGGVAQRVEEYGAHVEIVTVAREHESSAAVDHDGDGGHDQHGPAVHARRVADAAHGLDHDEQRHGQDGGGVGLGGEDGRAVVAERALGRRRPAREADGHQGDEHGSHVGHGVPRVGQQPEGVSEEAERHQDRDQRHVQRQHNLQAGLPAHALQATSPTSPTLAGGGRRCRSGGPPRG